MDTKINTDEKIKNGKLDVMGINIDISQVLGEKIIDQYIANLDEEKMAEIMKYISSDLFTEESIFNDKENKWETKFVIKKPVKDRFGICSSTVDIPISKIIKNKFNERIKEELVKKIDEIITTTEYQEKIDNIANDLIDYAIDGYKEDLKKEIRERLVNNVFSANPTYAGVSLCGIINDIIDKRFKY